MNGYNFTERVRKVLALASQEASRLNHEYVGTEHLLLGLIREGEGIANAVLDNLKIDSALIRQNIEATVLRGKARGDDLNLPYTSRAKKCIELSMAEARPSNSYGTSIRRSFLIDRNRNPPNTRRIIATATTSEIRLSS